MSNYVDNAGRGGGLVPLQPKKKKEQSPFSTGPPQPGSTYSSSYQVEAEAAARREKLLGVKQTATPEEHGLPQSSGKPVDHLAQHNVWLPINEVNKKVAQMVDAHERATGVPPSPALVRDLLLVDPYVQKAAVAYRDMFSRTNMPLKAIRGLQQDELMNQARYLGKHGFGHDVAFPGVDQDDWHTPGLWNTVARPGSSYYKKVEEYNRSVVASHKTSQEGLLGFFGTDFGFLNLGWIEKALFKTPGLKAASQFWDVSETSGLTPAVSVKIKGSAAYEALAPVLDRPWEGAKRAQAQIRDGLLNLPQGLILQAHAVGMDIYEMPAPIDLITGKASLHDYVPHRTIGIAESGFHQVVADFRDPEANLGYVMMDIFGIVSFGQGTVARIGVGASRYAAARSLVGSGDIGNIPMGRSALYRPGDAELVGEGDLAGHQYYSTFEEAQAASKTGEVHRYLIDSKQADSYVDLNASPTPDLFPVGETGTAAEGHTRVYRGQGEVSTGESNLPEWMKENQGRWFTTDQSIAARYAEERGGEIHFVDVPDETLKASQVEGGAGGPEYLLPEETVAGAKPLAAPRLIPPGEGEPSPMIFPASVETELVTPPSRLGAAAFVAGRTASGLLSRQVGGSGDYGFVDADGIAGTSVIVAYYDNGIARAVQKGYLKLSQKNLRARQIDGQYIFGNSFLDSVFAPEKKFKSILDKQVEAQQAIMLAPGLALQRMQGFESRGKQILRDVFTQPKLIPSILSLTSKERIGIETAIKMLATDSPDPLVDWKHFHEFKIGEYEAVLEALEASRATTKKTAAQVNQQVKLNKYFIAGHKNKLDMIDQAVKVLREQNPRLMKIYDQAVRVAKIRNDYQRAVLGLDDRTMVQSVAAVRHHIQGIQTGFTRAEGKVVTPRGVEAWDEAEAAFEQAKLTHETARQALLDERAKSLTRRVTKARTAKEARLQQGVDVALEQVDETQAALTALGDRPPDIPLTRIIVGELEQAERAAEVLKKAMKVEPNADIQQAIIFLEQGDEPSNVAAYLGHILDRWDMGALTWDDPAYGIIDPINEAIEILDGVPMDKLLYGEMRSERTPGGQLRAEFRSLERRVLDAEAEGRFPEDMPFWDSWVAINDRLGLDHSKRGYLLPEEPAQLKVFLDRAGVEMVKSEREARAMIQTAEEELQSMGQMEVDPQVTVDKYRQLEQDVSEIEMSAIDVHGSPDPEETVFFYPGTDQWEEWARARFDPDEISTMRDFINLNETFGMKPWLDHMKLPGGFHGSLLGDELRGDEYLVDRIRRSQPTGNTWGGIPKDVALHYETLRIQEGEAFLRGDMEAAQSARADQIAIDQQWYEGNEDMPRTSSITDEDLTQAARNATVPLEVQEATEVLETMRRRTGSFHISSRREIYRDDTNMGRMRQRLTPYGFKPPRNPDSHRHRTGAAIDFGDDRSDTSNLLLEQWGDVARIGEALKVYRQLWRSHGEGGPAWDKSENPDFKKTGRHKPIRDIQDAPEELKRAVAALNRLDTINAKDLRRARETIEDFAKWFYPDESEVDTILDEGGHVRWIDERFISEKTMGFDVNVWRNIDTGLGNLVSFPNEAWRMMLLFSSPAYALNAVGSSMLLLTKQGFLAPVNYGRALASRRIYGEEVTRILDMLAGNTHTMSYLPSTQKNFSTAISSLVTNAWQRITDTHFRRAAVIHELRRRGLLKDNLSPEEMADQLMSTDPEISRLVTEARHAGRNGMLNFDNMSWPEKAIARHLFFIYSFMRASAAYSLHYLFEHPAQYAELNATGRDREELIKKLIGDNLPQWFYDQGWIPIGPGEVINPNQLNMAGTINQLADPLYGMFSHTPYGNATGFLQGGPMLIGELITGRSLDTGQPFDQGSIEGSFIDMWGKTPLGRAFTRADQEDEEQVPPPMAVMADASNPIEAAMASERAAINMPTTLIQGFRDTFGRFIGRTAVSVHPNVPALQARHWRNQREANPEAYAQHEVDNLMLLVDAQEQVLGRSAPSEVRAAVTFVGRYTQHMNDWREGKIGGQQPPKDPNARQDAYETIRWMHKEKLMGTEEYRIRMANVRNPKLSESEVKNEKLGALWELGGKPWKTWNDQVRQVEFFAQEDYSVVLERLKGDGAGDYVDSAKASPEDAREYGRKALRFSNRWNQMRHEAAGLTGDQQKIAYDKIRVFEDGHSRPVEIGDATFPPLVLAGSENSFGRLTSPERADWVLSRHLRDWGSLASYEKEVLTGEKRPKAVAKGWRTLHEWVAADRARLQPGKKLPSGLTKYYAESIADQVPAFKKDWEEANAPLAQRMQDFNTIKNSSYSDEWSTLLVTASDYSLAATERGWPQGALGDAWKRDGVPPVAAWIARQDPGFRAEVQTYIDANPNFLTKLVKP